jgi:hypothetical protein
VTLGHSVAQDWKGKNPRQTEPRDRFVSRDLSRTGKRWEGQRVMCLFTTRVAKCKIGMEDGLEDRMRGVTEHWSHSL